MGSLAVVVDIPMWIVVGHAHGVGRSSSWLAMSVMGLEVDIECAEMGLLGQGKNGLVDFGWFHLHKWKLGGTHPRRPWCYHS